MQLRTVAAVAALGVVAAGAYAPATAAPKKFAGSYSVTLLPDPTPNAFHAAGKGNCFNVNPAAVDKRDFTMPRAGKLTVVLDSPDPTGTNNTDWDLYVIDAAGDTAGEGSGGTSHEEVDMKVKPKEKYTFAVCNLAGAPQGTVTYSLK